MHVPELFMQEQAKCNAALLVSKCLVFQRNRVQTVAHGRQFPATDNRLFLANSQNAFL
jgi:hypothetical protein